MRVNVRPLLYARHLLIGPCCLQPLFVGVPCASPDGSDKERGCSPTNVPEKCRLHTIISNSNNVVEISDEDWKNYQMK